MAFQNITPVKLGQAAITTGIATLYTVPTNTRTFLKEINIANTTSGVVNVTVYAGIGASTAQALLYLVPIRGNSTLQWAGSQILNAGDTIQIIASAVGCTITASGGEAT